MKLETFETLVEEYKEFILDDSFERTNAGIHDKDNQVPDLSENRFQKDLNEAKKILEKVNTFDKNSLSFEQKIDLELMQLALEKIIFSLELKYNNLFDWQQKPMVGSTIISGFLYLFLKDPRDAKTRLDAINSRFKLIPNMISQYSNVLKKPVSRWKNMEIEELEGINDLFNSILDWAKTENYSKMDELKSNIKNTNSAIKKYLKFLNKLEVETKFVIGEEKAKELVRLNGINLTMDDIYKIAKNFFANHNKKIEDLANKLKQKYNLNKKLTTDQVISIIKEKFSIPIEQVVPQYKKEQESVMNFLKNNDYFVMAKSDKLEILKTPSYLVPTIPVGAMFPPAPFENGPKVSLIYLTIDEGRAKDQNSLMITNTMIHEGIPGHHLQFAVAYENGSTVRSLANYNTHAEGWTTYNEEFMGEVGFIDKNILEEYLVIGYADFARLGARVAIDLYFLTGEEKYLDVIKDFTPQGKTQFEKAKSLLIKATGFTSARAEGELNWYSKERGYPMCYLLGNVMINEIKTEILTYAKNKDEAIKKFHKAYLTEGIMPLPLLRKILKHKGLIK